MVGVDAWVDSTVAAPLDTGAAEFNPGMGMLPFAPLIPPMEQFIAYLTFCHPPATFTATLRPEA
ncbi:hypothetical protein SY88_14730 [Clostridiales bacterium PH28_bin88]|nr:hypothetical protein SY88_14730 [Clostridiales bacterium PH28_bin88]